MQFISKRQLLDRDSQFRSRHCFDNEKDFLSNFNICIYVQHIIFINAKTTIGCTLPLVGVFFSLSFFSVTPLPLSVHTSLFLSSRVKSTQASLRSSVLQSATEDGIIACFAKTGLCYTDFCITHDSSWKSRQVTLFRSSLLRSMAALHSGGGGGGQSRLFRQFLH